MKISILLLAISTAALVSCSTVYKSGQTPDDVYYSPARVVEENTTRYRSEERVPRDYEEREIRMATYDRRWRSINDDYNYDYSYNPYRYGYSYGYYYNPYYYPCPVYISNVTIKNPINTTPRMTSLGSYTNTNTTVAGNTKYGTPTRVNTIRAYNNSNSGTYSRRTITTNTNSTQQTTRDNNDSRTYNPSTNTSSNSSSGSSSSGSISRPARKN